MGKKLIEYKIKKYELIRHKIKIRYIRHKFGSL